MNSQAQIVKALFDTKALRISPPDEPFFYTSGTIGPYYINTHFLFGSEADANDLLDLIESAVVHPSSLSATLWPRIERQYRENRTYRLVIDTLAEEAMAQPMTMISGGERRDYYFSMPVSRLIGKPHVSILKSGEAWFCDVNGQSDSLVHPDSLAGQTALHISDLVTEASSYTRTWIPSIQRLGASMPHTLTVVDRDQGGHRTLAAAGTTLHALTVFSPGLFDSALTAGLVNEPQHRQILQFLNDPAAFQSQFLVEHPEFLANEIRKGGKNADRAKLVQARFHVS